MVASIRNSPTSDAGLPTEGRVAMPYVGGFLLAHGAPSAVRLTARRNETAVELVGNTAAVQVRGAPIHPNTAHVSRCFSPPHGEFQLTWYGSCRPRGRTTTGSPSRCRRCGACAPAGSAARFDHPQVSGTQPISLDTTVPRTGVYAYDVGVWDLSIIQGILCAAPCQTLGFRVTIRNFCIDVGSFWCRHVLGQTQVCVHPH